MDQQCKARLFRNYHRRGCPLVLVNVWDAGTAKAAEECGAVAVATSSWAVAAASGFSDGERISLQWLLENAQRIVNATELPVSVDLESGYGLSPFEVAETVAAAIRVGAVGCNIEDRFPETGLLRPPVLQMERLKAARAAADRLCDGFFINARTDVFLASSASAHNMSLADVALERALAYHDAGADGIFVPGVSDPAIVARICKLCPLPINIMIDDHTPSLDQLRAAGVARVSYGAAPYNAAINAFRALAIGAISETASRVQTPTPSADRPASVLVTSRWVSD